MLERFKCRNKILPKKFTKLFNYSKENNGKIINRLNFFLQNGKRRGRIE